MPKIKKAAIPKGEINRRSSDMSELGVTGLDYQGGIVYEEFLIELSGEKGIKVYKEMSSNDAVIGAILFAIDMQVRQVSWDVKQATDDSVDIEAADFLKSCMHDMSMSWLDLISEILSMIIYGWSWHEIVLKRRLGSNIDSAKNSKFSDGKIGWRKMPIRSQDTLWEWKFDESGGVQGLIQSPPPDFNNRFIPIEKSLLFRTQVRKNNPEGKSVLRNAYRAWFFKKKIETIEGIGIERDLAGLPVALVPPAILDQNASVEEKAILTAVKKIVTNIRRDEQEGLVFPMSYDENGKLLYEIKLLSSPGSRQFDTNQIINRHKQEIAMTVLADFILLGHEKVGSFALASSKTKMFSYAIGSWLDSIAETFNKHAVPRLFKANGLNLETLPQITHGDIETVDLTELGEYISKLSMAGVSLFPDEKLEAYLKQQANLPITMDEE